MVTNLQIPYAYDEFVEQASEQFLKDDELLAVSLVVGLWGTRCR